MGQCLLECKASALTCLGSFYTPPTWGSTSHTYVQKSILVKVYLDHEHIWVQSAVLQIWLSKATISLRSLGETFCDATLSGCSLASAVMDG